MAAMQNEMSSRSRPGRAATGTGSGTLPGKRSEVAVVLAARVVPIEAERVQMALRCTGQSQAIGCGMTGVLQIHRFGCVWIDTHDSLRCHIDELRSAYRPFAFVRT